MRIQYIDKLKGMAILLVVMGHLAEKSMGITNSVFNLLYGSFHMPLFMFLSGIFAYKSFRNYNFEEINLFIQKKFFRVLIPFISVGCIYSFVYSNNPINVYIDKIDNYWFLPALFMCMILGLFGNLLSNKITHYYTKNKTFINLISWLIIYFILCVTYVMRFDFPYFLITLKMFPFFMFGAFYSESVKVKNIVNNSNFAFSLCLIIAILLLYYWDYLPHPISWTGALMIIVFTQLFIKYDIKIPNALSLIGKYSLEIYIFHWFFLPSLPGIKFYIESPCAKTLDNGNLVLIILLTLLLAIPVILLCIGTSIIFKKSHFL